MPAVWARSMAHGILDEIGIQDIEIFPKQDSLTGKVKFGNFINAPLFGLLVPRGKTVFVDPSSFEPYQDQWEFLERIELVGEKELLELCEINEWIKPVHESSQKYDPPRSALRGQGPLLPCARQMLEGVEVNQRVACFRLAVHFKRLGLPFDMALACLSNWAKKNRPVDGKKVICESEIIEQCKGGYDERYSSYGCDSPEVIPYCSPDCPLKKRQGY